VLEKNLCQERHRDDQRRNHPHLSWTIGSTG
jgi:hypothetical protein